MEAVPHIQLHMLRHFLREFREAEIEQAVAELARTSMDPEVKREAEAFLSRTG